MTRETQSQLLGEFYAEKKNILKLKGEDYANEDVLSNFKTAGANIGISAEQQCLSLIATKVARLGNLLSGKTPNNESVSDSILDLSNYTDLLYCLVNEDEENLITQDDLGKIKSAFNKNKADFLKIRHAKSQLLTPEECIKPKLQTKCWENVKPKAIINQIKWTDKCSDTADKIEEELRKLENSKKFHDDIKNELSKLSELSAELNNEKTECDCTEIPTEYKPTPEPTTEPYEPKVGDRFWNKDFEKSLKIIRIVEDLIVMRDYSEVLNFYYLSLSDFLNELENDKLKKIN